MLPFVSISLIKQQVLFHAHSKNIGADKTLFKIKEIGWWPNNMREDVENWVKTCEDCHHFKVRSEVKRPPMKSITSNIMGEGYGLLI